MTDVSVCMATYNGEKYLAEQLDSILSQLGDDDEIVAVDDCSTDGTVEVLRQYAERDPRLQVIARQVNYGYVRTFEQAIRASHGRYILLSDQDDVWTDDHVQILREVLGQDGGAVASNLATLGGPAAIPGPYGQKDWSLTAASSNHNNRNVLGILAGNMPYYGCAMGFRRELVEDGLLPFPAFLSESHDLWIALYANLRGQMIHREERTVLRRFHADNASPSKPRGVRQALASRAMLVRCIHEIKERR